LQDILHAIRLINKYASRGRSAFDQDELVQTWVIHHIEVIGEAVRSRTLRRTGYTGLSFIRASVCRPTWNFLMIR
jgi:hypothetical protein